MVTNVICVACGREFYRPPSQMGAYCSRACWYANKPKVDPGTRLAQRIDYGSGPDSCWNWTGSRLKTGYGNITVDGKSVRVHRLAYELANGKIPSGLYVLHKCDNRLCCNPSHLFIGDAKMNSDDKITKGRDNNHGESHYGAKLSSRDVRTIRTLRQLGESAKYIANLFGVSNSLVSAICNMKSRKHD